MRIIYMGTPDFAIPTLRKLLLSRHEIAAVVSAPDKERGRGRQISPTPVKQFAVENNLEMLTPVSLKDKDFISRLTEINADLFIVVAFRILPKEVYTLPKLGTFNLHGSLLPKYRGAAPIQWSLINGDTKTGVTTFFLEDKVDTGNIILQKEISINPEDDFGSLHDRMMILGAEAVSETVELIDTKSYKLQIQNDADSSPAPKILKDLCEINFANNIKSIHNLVRGLSPYPGAYFIYNEKNYKIFKTKYYSNNEFTIETTEEEKFKSVKFHSDPEVEIIQTKDGIYIRKEDGILQILELQPEGRKRMKAVEFLRGYSLI